MSLPTSHPGTLLHIPRPQPLSPLVAFIHQTPHPDPPKHTLLFLPGLFDGLLTVPYIPALAANLPAGWRLIEPLLRSCYRQFGVSSLGDDVEDVVELVRSLRCEGGKVVLMGHSTGCQVIMHYLLSPLSRRKVGGSGSEGQRPKVDGVIMQGGVSDREALTTILPPKIVDEACAVAKQYVHKGRGGDVLPYRYTDIFFNSAPITAQRFLSLTSPGPDHVGEDDYFSSDLDAGRLDTTFGKLGEGGLRVSFLFGEKDQYVPKSVDREGMVQRWEGYVKSGGGVVDDSSGILRGASHNLKEDGAVVDELVEKLKGFMSRV